MKLFGNDGISTNGKNNGAPILLLLLGILFFLAPLFLPHHETQTLEPTPASANATVTNDSNETSMQAAADRPWSKENEPAWAPSRPFIDQLRGISGILIVFSVFIVISLKLMQKTFPQAFKGQPKAGPIIKVLGKHKLGLGVQINIVQVGPKFLVLSVSDKGAQTLCELTAEDLKAGKDDEDIPGDGVMVAAERPSARQVYGQIFRQYLGIIPGVASEVER